MTVYFIWTWCACHPRIEPLQLVRAGHGSLAMKLPQFIPILTAFSARVAGCDIPQLLQSSTALARALADTQTVVGHDGVLCLFDPLLLASACVGQLGGGDPATDTHGSALIPSDEVLQRAPLSTLLESFQPLRHYLPDSAMLIATFSGPGLLYTQLHDALDSRGQSSVVDPDYVLDVILDVVRSSLESKVDGIALIEQTTTATPPDLLRCHKTVRRLADFYDSGFLVFNTPGYETQGTDMYAHCFFDLPSPGHEPALLAGQLTHPVAGDIQPFTTTGDVPANTPVERLKAMSRQTA